MSTRTRIKICGISTVESAMTAVEAGADYIGLVCVPESPRFVTRQKAAAIIKALPENVCPVCVVKNHKPDETRELVKELYRLGLRVQLHGPSRQALKEAPGYSSIVAVSFGESIKSDLENWGRSGPGFHQNLHAVLIDTADPSGLGGGTGKTFDWSGLRNVLDHVRINLPIVLAGGLTPENVADAIHTVRPWAVDVSSGVESRRGVKDPGKIRAFCDAVHRSEPHR